MEVSDGVRIKGCSWAIYVIIHIRYVAARVSISAVRIVLDGRQKMDGKHM